MDFGSVGKLYDPSTGRERNAHVFVTMLGFSRRAFYRVVVDQSAWTWLALHVEAFARFGGAAAALVQDNEADQVLSPLRQVQALVVYLKKFPVARTEAACERARLYGNHRYVGVKHILEKGLDLEALPERRSPPRGCCPSPGSPGRRRRMCRRRGRCAMSPTEVLVPLLKKLRLSRVLQTLTLRSRQAIDENLSLEELHQRLLGDEVERRDR